VLGLKKYDHISEGLKSLGWLDIHHKLKFNDCVMMYQCVNEGAPEYLSRKFKTRSQIHSRTTRNRNDLDLIKCRLATGQRSFSFRGAKSWNELPKSIRDATSLNDFKRNLMKLYLRKLENSVFYIPVVYKVLTSFIISYLYYCK